VSLTRGLFPAGIGLVTQDIQRIADAAAGADDAALQGLFAPGAANGSTRVKRVVPLLGETRTSSDPRSVRTLLWESATGRVQLLPCMVQVFGVTTAAVAQALDLSVYVTTALTSAAFASSAAGRVDVLYAVVTRVTPSGGVRNRRMKDTSSGAVSVAPQNVYSVAQVSLAVATGTEGSSTPATVPADGAGSYNVALARVALPAGYTSGDALFSGGGSYVTQVWSRAALRTDMTRYIRPGVQAYEANADAGATSSGGSRLIAMNASDRYASVQRIRAVFRQSAAVARVVLDSSINWTNRIVRVHVLRAASQASTFGDYPPPGVMIGAGGVSLGGASRTFDSGWRHAGSLGDPTAPIGDFYATPDTPTMTFYARASDGALVCTITEAPTDSGDGDYYTVIAEALDFDSE
jgi:hypothetical protein